MLQGSWLTGPIISPLKKAGRLLSRQRQADLLRLAALAETWARHIPRRDAADLLNEALARVLSGDRPWPACKTRIAEPKPAKGYLRWHGEDQARAAVYGNRSRLKSGVGKQAMRKRGEMVERSFAHILDRGGMRRAWLRGRENVHKRYLIHVAGFNLGILMRAIFGQGTSREAASPRSAIVLEVSMTWDELR